MQNKFDCWLTPTQIFDWAKANLNIIKPNSDLSEDEIARIMRWIGECSYDTIYTDGNKPKVGRHGINNMLFMTLMKFPNLYIEWGLSQPN
jgi:hypothetical protein